MKKTNSQENHEIFKTNKAMNWTFSMNRFAQWAPIDGMGLIIFILILVLGGVSWYTKHRKSSTIQISEKRWKESRIPLKKNSIGSFSKGFSTTMANTLPMFNGKIMKFCARPKYKCFINYITTNMWNPARARVCVCIWQIFRLHRFNTIFSYSVYGLFSDVFLFLFSFQIHPKCWHWTKAINAT